MLPIAWVDKIFQKMAIAYGREFMYKWEGIPEDEVKQDWAETLAGFRETPESLAHALKNLPEGKPPTAMEFRALCRTAPRIEPVSLPAPPVDRVKLAEVGEEVKKIALDKKDYLGWARKPRSRQAFHLLLRGCADKDSRMIDILIEHKREGVVVDMDLKKKWDGVQWTAC